MKSSDKYALYSGEKPENDVFASYIILCGGTGSRTGLPYNKIFCHTQAGDLLSMNLTAAEASCVSEIIVVYNENDRDEIQSHLGRINKPVKAVPGGATRTDSVRSGLSAVSSKANVISVHDGARPFVTPEVINESIFSAATQKCGIPAVKPADAIRVKDGSSLLSPAKEDVLVIQTPQSFDARLLKEAYASAEGSFEDDAAVFISSGNTPVFTNGSAANRKITTFEDVMSLSGEYRTGTGFDVHRLTEGRKLILGGVEIPYEKGLLGHSDADVLTHAVMDALLSAAGLPDIGVLFPDTDDRYLGISSMVLLEKVKESVTKEYSIVNVSAVVMAEKPKLAGIIPSIRNSLASALGIPSERVNVSATTTEKLGIVGKGEGMASSANVLLLKKY